MNKDNMYQREKARGNQLSAERRERNVRSLAWKERPVPPKGWGLTLGAEGRAVPRAGEGCTHLHREAVGLVTDPRTSHRSQTQGIQGQPKEAQLYAVGCNL